MSEDNRLKLEAIAVAPMLALGMWPALSAVFAN